MILEVARFQILAGHEEQFENAYRSVRRFLMQTDGFLSIRMTRGIESRSRFVLLVEWESVEAHQQNFRNGPQYAQWRAAIGPHFDGAPDVEHYRDI
jgi:heme-degrading monooxygenase HmoA